MNAYKSHGIDIWGLTPKNEPMIGWGNWGDKLKDGVNVTHMHRDFIKMNLGPVLEKAGYGPDKLKLMIYDDNSIRLKEFTEVLLSDKETAKYVSGIAYHWYTNREIEPDKILTEIHDKYSNHFLLNTEASLGDGDPRHLGDWNAGERYAYDIMRVTFYNILI